jgi:hypothetical protein
MVPRRLLGASLGLVSLPLLAGCHGRSSARQQVATPRKVPRLGFLGSGSLPVAADRIRVCHQPRDGAGPGANHTTPRLIARELERLQGKDPTQSDIEAADRALAEVAKRQAGVVRTAALVTDEAAAAPLAAVLGELADRKRQLEAERAMLLAQRSEWQVTRQQLASQEAWCVAMAATLDDLSYAERRQALHALGVDVRVAVDGGVYVLTAIQLPSVDTTTTGSPYTRTRLS